MSLVICLWLLDRRGRFPMTQQHLFVPLRSEEAQDVTNMMVLSLQISLTQKSKIQGKA
jgi:hypothetical protein